MAQRLPVAEDAERGAEEAVRPSAEPFLALKLGPYSCMCMWQDSRQYGSIPSDDRMSSDPWFDPELRKYGGRFDRKVAIGQVTFRFPFEWRPLNIIALLYGFLPFAVPFAFFAFWLNTRHFLFLYGLLLSLVTSVVNELALKPCCDDPRPIESANREPDGRMKPGMPSGHVLNAVTIMVWALLEVLLSGPGMEDHPQLTWEWVAFITVLMAPVPWARIYNKDHSLAQCIVAGMLGLVVGVAAYHLRANVFEHRWKPWDSTLHELALEAAQASTTVLPASLPVLQLTSTAGPVAAAAQFLQPLVAGPAPAT